MDQATTNTTQGVLPLGAANLQAGGSGHASPDINRPETSAPGGGGGEELGRRLGSSASGHRVIQEETPTS